MDELAAIFPESNILQIAGEPVDVSPMKLGEAARFSVFLKDFSQTIEGIRTAIAAREADQEAFAALDVELESLSVGEIALELLSGDTCDKVINGMTILCRHDRAFIEALELDDAVKLLGAVIASNFDMFQKKLLPAISTNMQALSARIGALPSSGLSPADTV
jgi:hypothetical protein